MTALCLKARSFLKTERQSNVSAGFNTEAKSCLFIKQLTSTCISTILYLRKVLSDDYFETKSFEGMTLKLLKSRKGENYVSKIEQWLDGAFEAVEKKYLKRLMLDIQDAESNMTLEIYTMSFNYNTDKEILNPLIPSSTSFNDSGFSASNTKLNTIKLLQMCHAVTQTYSNLPSKVKLSMRLYYYENTPAAYQPRGYMAWEPVDPRFPKQARSIEIGLTSTQHHLFKLFNKSCLSDKFFKDLEDQSDNTDSTLTLAKADDVQESGNVSHRQTKAKGELYLDSAKKSVETSRLFTPKKEAQTTFFVSEKCTSIPNFQMEKCKVFETKTKKKPDKKISEGNAALKKVLMKADLKNQKVRCACLSSLKTKTMFACLSCRFLVHAECYGILYFDSTKKVRFFCHLCHHVENNWKCHDKVIMGLKNSSDRQKLSLLRRVLHHCNMPSVKTITLKKMKKICGATCPTNVLNAVLNKMIEIGVAKARGKRTNLIDKQALTNKLVHYFYRVQNSNSQPQIMPYSLRSSVNSKRKTDFDELLNSLGNERSKHSATLTCNSQTSQQSCDIFC